MTDMSTDKHAPRVGYAAGAFDLFHVGHLNILRQAKMHCDHLIAGVVSDDLIEITKGHRPVVSLRERMEIVEHIRYVDQVHPEDGQRAEGDAPQDDGDHLPPDDPAGAGAEGDQGA